MILTIDTETTGLPVKDRPISDSKAWPHIVGLTFIVSEDDGSGADEYTFLVKPEGWEVPAEAVAIHGITTEIAAKYGFHIWCLLHLLDDAAPKCSKVIGHGLLFDYNVLLAEYRRMAMMPYLQKLDRYCTMIGTTDLCNLPGKFDKPKWPKLTELHNHLFGTQLDGAHDSSVDARATLRCYAELKNRGLVQ